MKRRSRLTLVLLITGVLPAAFLPVWFVLGTASPYVALGLFVLPLCVFVLLFSFVGFSHTLKTARQRFERLIPTSCIICGESLPNATLRQFRQVQGLHYETVHPDLWRWLEKRRRRGLPVWLFTLSILALVAFYELVTGNYLLFIVSGALFAAFVLGWNWFEKRKLKSFRSQWKNSNSMQKFCF